MLFGALVILQSNTGREFINLVTNEFHIIWNEVKTIYEKPRHGQSQKSVELAKRDVQEIIDILGWIINSKTMVK